MDLWRFLTRIGLALTVRGIEIIGKFGLYGAVAALASPADGGVFFFCSSWAHLAATLARRGLDRALIRHLAADLATGRGDQARADLRQAMRRTLTGGVLAALVTAGVALGPWIGWLPMGDLSGGLLLTALVIMPQTLMVTLCGALSGLGRTVTALTVQNAIWPLATLALVVAGFRQADQMMAALAIAMLLALLVAGAVLWLSRRQFDVPAGWIAAPVSDLPPVLETARPLANVEAIQVALATLPTLVLGLVATAETVGAFSLAQRISMLVWAVLISLGTLAAPRMSSLYRMQDFAALFHLNRVTQGVGAAVAGGSALVLLLIPAWLLSLFNPAYAEAALALQILAAGQIVNAAFAGQDVMLAMMGRGVVLQRINLVQFALCLAGCLLAVPLLGAEGAALTGALPTALGALLMAIAVRAHLGKGAVVGPGAVGSLHRFFGQGS